MRHISELIVRMAQENQGWGYTRIQGALANLDHKVGRGTIANVLTVVTVAGITTRPDEPWMLQGS